MRGRVEQGLEFREGRGEVVGGVAGGGVREDSPDKAVAEVCPVCGADGGDA